MSKKNVELYQDQIIELLKKGYSPSRIETELLPITRNDISRYFNEVTGEDYKQIQEEAEEKRLKEKKENAMKIINKEHDINKKSDNYQSNIKYNSFEALRKKVIDLNLRVKALENGESYNISNSNQKVSIKKAFSNDLNFRKIYSSSDKKINSFRLLEANKNSLEKTSKELGISINELINFLIYKYL